MALSRFPAVMPRAAEAVIAAADALRYIRDTSGDLRLREIDGAIEALRTAKLACLAALAEGQKQPAAAEAFMASLGGPETLADFGAALVQIDAAATAWNDSWAAWLGTLAVSDLIQPATMIREGVDTRYIARIEAVSDATAAPLRQAQALDDLIAALEATGA
ncbi:hypothetical protein BV509_01100 [Rhodovulum sulfidophilum]|uniref:Uncharacterized protein n=1 Tax=Rhodovulum visakhapatnamense TaxID=364297 RepID=A0ABS1RFH2_9RHOB|nr:hypothetical protein [Rhodovulum visakhapatnamense]MBL3569931.1 hypothetical protein [Rhodovulum visakhapatnamense]MBL3578376.1 hypothetical protein [Rhodovulum visakhapatnamense]OLS43083.1 hypothetical protein BV509_01100 [Rhodovulum sulfidophilum]